MKYSGLVIKGVGGLYTVKTEVGLLKCKAKGRLRKERISPLAGDRVTVSSECSNDFVIEEILERKNKLVRPPVANIDKLFIVVSVAKPYPNMFVIDKMTVLAEKNNIKPVIIVTKTDLSSGSQLIDTYKSAGYNVYHFSNEDKTCKADILNEINGCLVAFTGNSGVGKSTLINSLNDELQLETGEISDKLGRGRHTTRQAEIFPIGGGLVIDTAGFSSIDFVDDNVLLSEDLQYYFNEFNEYIGQCRFIGCSHMGDKGCKICEKVENGDISKSRYESYTQMYNELKNIKKWQI